MILIVIDEIHLVHAGLCNGHAAWLIIQSPHQRD